MEQLEILQSVLKQVLWQDYRGTKEAIVITYESCESAKLPIRDVLNKSGRGSAHEPNYETGTYGYFECADPRGRNSFIKNRKGYIFFLTNYQGKEKDFNGRDFIIGYYKVSQTSEVRKRHTRNLLNNSCVDLDSCIALRALEQKFVAIEDGFELTKGKLQSWGYKGKLARQLKLAFNEEKVLEILAHFESKQDQTARYTAETEKLLEKLEEAQETEIEEGIGEAAPETVEEATEEAAE